jgi:hypothetical protein
MRIYKISSTTITAYHGTDKPFKKWNHKFSTQGIFWFTENIEEIINETSGASSNKYILKCELTVEKTAGWEEYDKYYLQQIKHHFDSIKLDSNWIIFDPNRIKIIDVIENKKG